MTTAQLTVMSARPRSAGSGSEPMQVDLSKEQPRKLRVFVAAENRLLYEALSRVLTKPGMMAVFGRDTNFDIEALLGAQADVLLLASRGNNQQDLDIIRQVRSSAPHVQILLIGMARDEAEFLQCVRAGIRGYLLRDASADEVLAAVRAVHAGEAVCPGALCFMLFRYIEQGTPTLRPGHPYRRIKWTHREQQLISLVTQGLTNKEIAHRLSLSEQTVKNHLQRMKQKLGVKDRLEFAQLYHAEGVLLERSRVDTPATSGFEIINRRKSRIEA